LDEQDIYLIWGGLDAVVTDSPMMLDVKPDRY